MKTYKHLFFDLDNTLWDFTTNSRDTLLELFEKYSLEKLGVPSFEFFHEKYVERNIMMWEQYRLNKIEEDGDDPAEPFKKIGKGKGDKDDRAGDLLHNASEDLESVRKL